MNDFMASTRERGSEGTKERRNEGTRERDGIRWARLVINRQKMFHFSSRGATAAIACTKAVKLGSSRGAASTIGSSVSRTPLYSQQKQLKQQQRHFSDGSSASSSGIGFALSSEQKELQDLARSFTAKEIIPNAAHHDRTGEYPTEILKKVPAHQIETRLMSIPTDL